MDKEKNLLFIAATHGDEGFSLDVLKKLEKSYPREKCGYDWIIGNEQALKRGVRFIESDLNRSAPGSNTSVIYEERRAAQIMEIAKGFKSIIDLHGTAADCGIVSIIPFPTLQNVLFAAMFPMKRNVIWYAKSSMEKGPLVQFIDGPAIELECGPKDFDSTNNELADSLSEFLENRNNWNFDKLFGSLRNKEFYNVIGLQREDGKKYLDFSLVQNPEDQFYPFLSNQYPGIACYKMKRVNFEELFLR